jgi:NitT/TauT family transport system substrate-binding protein
MKRRTFALAAVAAALAPEFGLAAAPPRIALSIATVASDPLALPLYAKELGFFDKAGIDATINSTMNGAAVTSAVAGGAVDIGGSNASTLVLAFKKGVPITVVAPGGLYSLKSPVQLLVVPKSSPIMTPKDLEGKIVAVSPLKSISEYAPEAWIDKNGGDSSKVKFVELPFGEMEAAMLQGRVQASFFTEPYISKAKATSRVLGDPYTAVAPQFLTAAFFTGTALSKTHPDTVTRFAAVMRQTAAWANANRQKSGEILAATAKLDASIVSKMSRVTYAETLTPELIQPNIELFARFKVIESFNAKEMIYDPSAM